MEKEPLTESTPTGQITPTELRVRVATILGFSNIEGSAYGDEMYGDRELGKELLPDYCNDLNACAEFEKILLANHEQGARYRAKLSANSDGRNAMFLTAEAAMCHATAAQRCQAFVKLHES